MGALRNPSVSLATVSAHPALLHLTLLKSGLYTYPANLGARIKNKILCMRYLLIFSAAAARIVRKCKLLSAFACIWGQE
jgi:hypothetical protein